MTRTPALMCMLLVGTSLGCGDGGIEPVDPDAFNGANGVLPGSECRPADDPAGPCDQDLSGVEAIDMVCVSNTCVVDCSEGGNFVCQDLVSEFLTCSSVAGDVCVRGCVDDGVCGEGSSCLTQENACLPTGSFPGSECRAGDAALDAGPCDQDLSGNPNVDMGCVRGRCVIDCAAGGTELCQGVSPLLTCSAAGGDVCVAACDGTTTGGCDLGFSCFEQEASCLPTGAFPTSPCRETLPECDTNVGGVAGADMLCVENQCVVGCTDPAVCAQLDASLTCSQAAGGLCLRKCVAGACDAGFSCFETEGACLPTGAFPGSPCREGTGEVCDAVGGASQRCVSDTCLVDCATDGDAVCEAVDPSLTCSATAGSVCLPACDSEGACADPAFSCFATDNACLPTGSFPGSPCRGGADRCDHDLGGTAGIDLECVADLCLIDCSVGGTPLCQGVNAGLACSNAAGGCVPACQDGACPDGLSCFATENSCLPTGAFPGSPCAAGALCAQDLLGVEQIDMTCAQGTTCAVDCSDGGNFLCDLVDPSLACSPAAGGLCVLGCDAAVPGTCPSGFACFASEGTCLPEGSFPGSPCIYPSGPTGEGLCASVGGASQVCQSPDGESAKVCLVSCSAGGQNVCQAVDPGLSCLDPAIGPSVCLPNGTFPGSLCRPGGACDQDVGAANLDLTCIEQLCEVDCSAGGDPLCAAFSAGAGLPVVLVCGMADSVSFCTVGCSEPTGCRSELICDDLQNACIP